MTAVDSDWVLPIPNPLKHSGKSIPKILVLIRKPPMSQRQVLLKCRRQLRKQGVRLIQSYGIFVYFVKPHQSIVLRYSMSQHFPLAILYWIIQNMIIQCLSGINDLIAAEAKYHKSCMRSFEYSSQKVKSERTTTNTDIAMIFLTKELQYASNKCQIINLSDVWDRYCTIALETSTEIPSSYTSRRATSKEALQKKTHSVYQFVLPMKNTSGGRETILVPHSSTYSLITGNSCSNLMFLFGF